MSVPVEQLLLPLRAPGSTPIQPQQTRMSTTARSLSPLFDRLYRGGVEKMLRDLHERYQLYIYTHGTRQYAEAVARVIDPTRTYFQGRIISRTDNPDGMHYKLLSQLFPCDDTMALKKSGELRKMLTDLGVSFKQA